MNGKTDALESWFYEDERQREDFEGGPFSSSFYTRVDFFSMGSRKRLGRGEGGIEVKLVTQPVREFPVPPDDRPLDKPSTRKWPRGEGRKTDFVSIWFKRETK